MIAFTFASALSEIHAIPYIIAYSVFHFIMSDTSRRRPSSTSRPYVILSVLFVLASFVYSAVAALAGIAI
jgi:hypothetical protein